jgi:PEP-CTERM motif
MRRYLLAIPLALWAGVWTPSALADSVPIGQISFDVNIPAQAGLPGVNSFDLLNITGGLTDPSRPGVLDVITLSGQLSLSELVGGTTVSQTIPFTSIGLLTTDLFDISSDVQILSATLTGTLDNTFVTLNGGTSPVTLSSSFSVTDPFNGGIPLTACDGTNTCSQGILSATVAEPGSLLLLGSGIGSFLLRKRRRRAT